MKVLLEYCFDHRSSRRLYGHIAKSLRRRGAEALVVQSADAMDLSAYDVLISHDFVDRDFDGRLPPRAYGGHEVTRPDSLAMIAAAGVPVMPWARAAETRQVLDLFERWQARRLLLKRSGTIKGNGITVFDRDHIGALLWHPERDLFCPDLNESDGDVYKIEMFNGRWVLGWVSRSPPLSRDFDGFKVGVKGAFGRRRLIGYPRSLRAAAGTLSRELTARGIGYVSLDLMKNEAGELVAIEVNTGQVATWWTARFPWVRWRYARAVRELLKNLPRI